MALRMEKVPITVGDLNANTQVPVLYNIRAVAEGETLLWHRPETKIKAEHVAKAGVAKAKIVPKGKLRRSLRSTPSRNANANLDLFDVSVRSHAECATFAKLRTFVSCHAFRNTCELRLWDNSGSKTCCSDVPVP